MAKRHVYDVQCPQCGWHMKMPMRGRYEGTRVGMRCGECHHVFKKVITMADRVSGVPSGRTKVSNPLLLEFGKTLCETMLSALGSNGLLNEQVEKLKEAGYEPNITIEFKVSLAGTGAESREPTPLVKDGRIVPGAFSEQDQNELKVFHISLGGE